MNLLRTILSVALLLVFSHAIAQSEVEALINEGVRYHDQGEYDKAIETYQKALSIDPQSALANYEIALTYFEKEDYANTVKHSDVVLNQKGDYMIPAYLINGSALDLQGRTKESIKLFKKAIKKTDGHYLIYYNLALNYFNLKDIDNAEEYVIKAIEKNPRHPSSHIMLAVIHDQRGNSVQSLMASHYYLLLEPGSQRSETALKMLQQNFSGNVTQGKGNNINIMLSSDSDSEFMGAELMISMLEVSKTLDENKDKSEDELFIENTKAFFSVLGETKEKGREGIWWSFYVPFLYELAKSDHMETYCMFITQSGNENSEKWLVENEQKVKAFEAWLEKNQK
ncbi:MAG: tetratricopeptide repeat protein [Bacteroidota bacterium]